MTAPNGTPNPTSATTPTPRSLFEATVERLVGLDDDVFAALQPAELTAELPTLRLNRDRG